MRRTTTAIIAALLVAGAVARAADTGSGTFRLGKSQSAFQTACAYRIPYEQTPGVTVTAVFLADRPLDCAKADESFDPIAVLEAQVDAGDCLHFVIEPGGARADGSWRSPKSEGGFGLGGQGKLTLAKDTESRVEGRWRTEKPESFFKETFEFDLKFAADVRRGAISGKPLPNGGGDPGKAYQAYLQAVAKSDPDALRRSMTESEARETLPADFAAGYPMLRELDLKQATISGGLVRGDTAALDVQGVSWGGDKMSGRVLMARVNGAWKYAGRKLRMTFD